MENIFAVADPRDDARGGHLNFTIHDGAATIPGRISSAAMRILADDSGFSPTEVFTANQAKIRSAAYTSRRFNPQLAMVLLSVNDFS
jgi:hypothetical protein